jgi:predicted O-methyltransferase YrrM
MRAMTEHENQSQGLVSLLKAPFRAARGAYHDWQFERARRAAFERLGSHPQEPIPADILHRLIQGWGNVEFAAKDKFLQRTIHEAQRATGNILECGSGLSTMMLGRAAGVRGVRIVALEHMREWADVGTAKARDYGIEGSTMVSFAPLGNFGDYDWYQPSAEALKNAPFALVICDGPPGNTKGGRYGVLPRMREHLAPGCLIVLDDAVRPDETIILERWKKEYPGISIEMPPGERYALIRLP